MTWALYDTLGYTGKPSPISPGIKAGKIYYEAQFFPTADHTGPVSAGAMSAIAANAVALNLPPQTPICLDIESWPVYTVAAGDTVSLDKADESITKYVNCIRGVKAGAPNLLFGYFGAALPMEDGFYAISKSAEASRIRGSMRMKNTLLRRLARECDVLFPSCYAFSGSAVEWADSFRMVMAEARTLNPSAQIIPFLWPQFYANGPGGVGGAFIPADLWRTQLELCWQLAGGAMLWSSNTVTWADASAAPWWVETQAFLCAKGIYCA